MQARFLDSGEDVEVEYKNQNHITIINENRESKNQQGQAESE